MARPPIGVKIGEMTFDSLAPLALSTTITIMLGDFMAKFRLDVCAAIMATVDKQSAMR